MVKRQQNRKQQRLNKSRTRNTLCQSKFTRTGYYKAVGTLRAFAFLEFEQYLPRLADAITPREFFEGPQQKRFQTVLPNSDVWWHSLRYSEYKGYAYVTRLCSVAHLIPKLAVEVLTTSDFNEDWTLTEQGHKFKEKLRKRWEHRIKIGDKYFFFSSARQLLNVILDDIEDCLNLRCNDFIVRMNEEINNLFDSVELDGIPTCGATLRKALGLRQLPEDYGLMMTLRQGLYQRGHEKNASNLIRKFSEEPIENLVSNDYLERIVGLIQTRSSTDES